MKKNYYQKITDYLAENQIYGDKNVLPLQLYKQTSFVSSKTEARKMLHEIGINCEEKDILTNTNFFLLFSSFLAQVTYIYPIKRGYLLIEDRAITFYDDSLYPMPEVDTKESLSRKIKFHKKFSLIYTISAISAILLILLIFA